ncbi:hypothetical protein [Mucilaginibacter xinganensis]|uniref:Uncharacterized protein n=1 Tax=Mucilaginibacter xinganensis TaxID=1234841 RepID=A0A223P1G7_9SPHI|nr:hypothetical protein [Mucilaginibacter xinganensis]ASU35965.1 hypothetical protein MuYL_4080 [Mucilaginibacter xinganensis]
MKKLVSVIFAVLMTSLFFQGCKNSSKTALLQISKQTVFTTLNGIDAVKAGMMIQHFKDFKGRDRSPMPTSVWFSIETINNIDTLLHAERKTQTETDTTDGVRIYFVSDPSISTTQLKTSVLLVSTKNDDSFKQPQSRHRDYYNHQALFLNSGATGTISYGKTPGALLYETSSPCSLSDNTCINYSKHYVNCADSYVWVSKQGKDTVNTISEWFDLDFISFLNNGLHKNKLDGVRIYFAKGYKDPLYTNEKDVFVLVPTINDNGTHKDYYKCLEDSKKWFDYDKGELCPFNCN